VASLDVVERVGGAEPERAARQRKLDHGARPRRRLDFVHLGEARAVAGDGRGLARVCFLSDLGEKGGGGGGRGRQPGRAGDGGEEGRVAVGCVKWVGREDLGRQISDGRRGSSFLSSAARKRNATAAWLPVQDEDGIYRLSRAH
jgi:hypothetical protein